jgi:DNA mismatch endonuclease (patch repair protein)
MDIWSKEKRSDVMSRIHGKNTKPEIAVRSALHRRGFRFRLHKKDLPGHPDLVLPKYKTVVFIHGCFWHQHKNCRNCSIPKNHKEMWQKKLERNVERDKRNIKRLKHDGWNVFIFWECEIERSIDNVIQRCCESFV